MGWIPVTIRNGNNIMCRQTGCGVGVDYISIIMMMMCLVTHLNNRSAACHVEGPVTCSWILMI